MLEYAQQAFTAETVSFMVAWHLSSLTVRSSGGSKVVVVVPDQAAKHSIRHQPARVDHERASPRRGFLVPCNNTYARRCMPFKPPSRSRASPAMSCRI